MTEKKHNLIPLFMFGAAVANVIAHPDMVAKVIEATMKIRCPTCGYVMGHPIVRHEYPWNNHLNGWYPLMKDG